MLINMPSSRVVSLWVSSFALIMMSASTFAKVVYNDRDFDEFAFISKFAFDTRGEGTTVADIVSSSETTWLLAYIDEGVGSWRDIYGGSNYDCYQRINASAWKELIYRDNTTTIRFIDQMRPHFFFFAVADCESPTFHLEYRLEMTNYGNNSWTKQFSFDEQGLEALYVFYFMLFFIGVIVHCYSVWKLYQRNLYFSVIKFMSIALSLEFVSIMFCMIHYSQYADNGIGVPRLKVVGDFVESLAQVTFLLILVLIARGFCITKYTLENPKLLLAGSALLTVAYLALLIWTNVGIDPASTLYIYASVPGIIILFLRAVVLGWFLYSIYTTFFFEKTSVKRHFYIYFGVAFSLWILTLPIITIIALFLEPWYRLKTVTLMYVTMNAVGMGGVSFLMWPSRVNKYFHISSRLSLRGVPYEAI